MLQERHEEPSTLPAVLVKDEETVSKEVQTVSDSQLDPYQLKGKHYLCYAFMLSGCFFSFYSKNSIKLLSGEPKVENLEDHCYAASPTLADHQYASHGPLWFKECDALQDELVGEIPPVKYGIPAWFNDAY